MNSPYISLEVINLEGKRIDRRASHKSRRIFRFIQRVNNLDARFRLIVVYPSHTTNEGAYTNKNDLLQAIRAFLERD